MGKRQKVKYEIVESDEDKDELFERKRPFFNYTCMWSTLFTSILIGTYYVPSICLTFYQRWLFQTFHFPLMTVLIHMLVKYLLSALIRLFLHQKQSKPRIIVEWKEYLIAMVPMGFASGLDIGFSNWGLELIQVSLYTMTKSTTIIFILGFSMLLKLEKKSWSLGFIVSMITVGLILFTYKSTHFDTLGFSLLLCASMFSGIRWSCVQLLLQKSKMGIKNPIDMIYHMQPWMIVSVLPFAIWMEGSKVIENCQLISSTETEEVFRTIFKVLFGAFLAFFMEVCEVLVVRYTSSLTLSIAGIVKEVFILVLAVEWNGDQLSSINALGLFICLTGISCHVIHKLKTTSKTAKNYAHDEHRELGEKLILNEELNEAYSEIDEKDDSQILIDFIRNRDR